MEKLKSVLFRCEWLPVEIVFYSYISQEHDVVANYIRIPFIFLNIGPIILS